MSFILFCQCCLLKPVTLLSIKSDEFKFMIDSQGFLAIKRKVWYVSLLLGAGEHGIYLVLSVLQFSVSLRTDYVSDVQLGDIATAQAEEPVEVEVAEGYTTTQFCDKIIEVFLNEKPKTKEWRKYIVFREEWKKYRESFYNRCRSRANAETDPTMKNKLISLGRKVKKVEQCIYFSYFYTYALFTCAMFGC